jgi:hypothetical protein
LLGRWVFDDVDGPAGVHLNGCLVRAGEALVPDPTGHWALVCPGDVAPARGRFLEACVPDEQDIDALLELGGLLESTEARTWLNWSALSPLAPNSDEVVRVHPLEKHIRAELEHLDAVCRNPHTHVRIESERVLVSRARRIATGATAWLSAHTEDWGHRTLSGVQPRRILADVREEQWDLYENRLAARLIDHLIAWLRRRIAEIARVREGFFTPLEAAEHSPGTSRQRRDRIYRLWGEVWDDQARGMKRLDEAKQRLEQLLYALLGLMDSPLYRRIPRRAWVPRGLKITNLLANDDRYRGVARLWHQWSRLLVPRPQTTAEHYARWQALDRAFVAWSALLVVRACDQLRLSPRSNVEWERELERGCVVELDSGISLEWECGGPLCLRREGKVLLRLVPLLHAIEAASPDVLHARMQTIANGVAEDEHWTVILHPAVPDVRGPSETSGVGHPPQPGGKGAIDFVRVSPFALDSVERLARAIRWAVLTPRMLAYPPVLEGTTVSLESFGDGIESRGEGRWAMPRPLSAHEVRRHDLHGRLERARREHENLQAEREELEARLRASRGDQRQTGDLNQRKRSLLVPIREAERVVEGLKGIVQQYQQGRSLLDDLSKCPICAGAGSFEARSEGCFEARCDSTSCAARWGLRRTSKMAPRIPFLLPGTADSRAWPRNAPPQWVDELLGADVLAIPRVGEDHEVSFGPPEI